MRTVCTLMLVALSAIGVCQSYHYKPQWKVGDRKQITMMYVDKEYEDDKLVVDSTYYNEARVKVLKEEDDKFILEIFMENQAMQSAAKFYDRIGEELKNYKDLKLVYSVDKQTAESHLINWEEAQKFVTESIEGITKVLEEKAPESAGFVSLLFMPLVEVFNTKENVEAYMEANIGYLLVPFGKDFQLGVTLSETETQENPFNPSKNLEATTLLTLEKVDALSHMCEIRQEIILDLSQFIEAMRDMVKKMGESFGGSEESTEKKLKEIEDFTIDLQNQQVITFNNATSWVTGVESKVTVSMPDPRTGVVSRKELKVTTTVK
jgi:hypothetical protein